MLNLQTRQRNRKRGTPAKGTPAKGSVLSCGDSLIIDQEWCCVGHSDDKQPDNKEAISVLAFYLATNEFSITDGFIRLSHVVLLHAMCIHL
jgi:hypothetical protein